MCFCVSAYARYDSLQLQKEISCSFRIDLQGNVSVVDSRQGVILESMFGRSVRYQPKSRYGGVVTSNFKIVKKYTQVEIFPPQQEILNYRSSAVIEFIIDKRADDTARACAHDLNTVVIYIVRQLRTKPMK